MVQVAAPRGRGTRSICHPLGSAESRDDTRSCCASWLCAAAATVCKGSGCLAAICGGHVARPGWHRSLGAGRCSTGMVRAGACGLWVVGLGRNQPPYLNASLGLWLLACHPCMLQQMSSSSHYDICILHMQEDSNLHFRASVLAQLPGKASSGLACSFACVGLLRTAAECAQQLVELDSAEAVSALWQHLAGLQADALCKACSAMAMVHHTS